MPVVFFEEIYFSLNLNKMGEVFVEILTSNERS